MYQNTAMTYFPGGEAKFEELLRQLETAEEYIFVEYFIIDEGLMWGKILEVLARKALQGVDVRVMYDGTCEFSTLPRNYPRLLEKLNIQCKVFSPVQPFVSTHYNYRDHRKILVIDGRVGFTGGVNLADEYINHIQKHGRWKDAAVMLEGEAVRSLTAQFLQMWGILKEPEYEQFLTRPIPVPENAKGVAAPYGDCPLDGERVGEMVYIDLLNRARDYIHIMTPYLILDGELETALKFAAERGVDVHLILPGKPDKRFPYALAKSHYSALLDSGVKISEWSPGFVHAKVFVVDGREAVVGTINLDYRSLYHHFEDAVWMVDAPCIRDIEQDFQSHAGTVPHGGKYLGQHLAEALSAPCHRNAAQGHCTAAVTAELQSNSPLRLMGLRGLLFCMILIWGSTAPAWNKNLPVQNEHPDRDRHGWFCGQKLQHRSGWAGAQGPGGVSSAPGIHSPAGQRR